MIFQYLGLSQKHDPRNRGLEYMDDRCVAASARDFVRQLGDVLPAPRLLVLCVWAGAGREGSARRRSQNRGEVRYRLAGPVAPLPRTGGTADMQYLRCRSSVHSPSDGRAPSAPRRPTRSTFKTPDACRFDFAVTW